LGFLSNKFYEGYAMTIKAEIVADSVFHTGLHITTALATYPLMVHAELMTHRAFARCASSSRAIPFKTMLARAIKDPAMPVSFGKNQRGMQAGAELTGFRLWLVKQIWRKARWPVMGMAILMHSLGVHKQVVNRLLAPWSHITVVITSVYWDNFFALRCHEAADPTMHALADAIFAAREASTPVQLKKGEWHLPFLTDEEKATLSLDDQLKLSAERCARTSYGKNEGYDETFRLYNQLVGSAPVHASPLEHQATGDEKTRSGYWKQPQLHGNLTGCIQHRKLIKGEALMEKL
jgi:hypothetical protein